MLERNPDRLRFEWLLAGVPSVVEVTLEPVPQAGDPPAAFTRVTVAHTGIPEREEGRRLVCAFELHQPPTTVTWLLEPLPDGRTRVTVREEGLTWEGIDNHIGWHDYLVALYQETQPSLIRQAVWVPAPPARVWPQVATEAGLRRWFSPGVRFAPAPGALVAFAEQGRDCRGGVVAIQPEARLVFTWTEAKTAGWPREPEPLQLTIDLAPEGDGTRVTITLSGFENLPEPIGSEAYARYLREWSRRSTGLKLKRVVEEWLARQGA